MLLSDYIQNISRDAVVEGVRNIKSDHLSSNNIVSQSNPLVINGPISVVEHADTTNAFRIVQPEINSFLAASSLSHLMDGWMYLSHAFNSILAGDVTAAIHLGYYAELRSAMSILATEGLGIFDKQHLGVFSPSSNDEYPTNSYKNKGNPPVLTRVAEKATTHKFTWEAMNEWSMSTSKPNIEILRIFKVSGKDFYDLTEHFHPSTAGSILLTVQKIKEWLKDWCLDISLYQSDRDIRNEVSYRPQRINNFNERIDFQSIINDLDKYWSVISPSNTDKFSLLDRYLLRKLYSSLYPTLHTTTPKIDLIRNAFNQHGINDETLFNFLDFQAPYSNDHLIFTNANIQSPNTLSILARATLLLRISIGLVSQLYKDGGINKNELDFVWKHYGVSSGFWVNSEYPVNFANLWFDIQPSIGDLITDINSPGVENSLFSIKQRNTETLAYFGQINRACLWGIDF